MITCIVFDLDEVLWTVPGSFCAQLTPPLKPVNKLTRKDAHGKTIRLFDGVPEMLGELSSDYLLCTASRNYPSIGEFVLKDFGIRDYFTCLVLAWQDKDTSIIQLKDKLALKGHDIPYEEMLFLDDWPENVADAKELGVNAFLTHPGQISLHFVRSLISGLD